MKDKQKKIVTLKQ